jgi:hypothetical protein
MITQKLSCGQRVSRLIGRSTQRGTAVQPRVVIKLPDPGWKGYIVEKLSAPGATQKTCAGKARNAAQGDPSFALVLPTAPRHIPARSSAAPGCRKFRIARNAHCAASPIAHKTASRNARIATDSCQPRSKRSPASSAGESGAHRQIGRQDKSSSLQFNHIFAVLYFTNHYPARGAPHLLQ